MPDVFISYSRRDKDFVERLTAALANRQKEAWVDWEDIPPSAEWFREIEEGIDGSDAFLYVISPDSVTSEVCGRELAHALERNKRIVPILHREPSNGDVPAQVAALNWVFLRDEDSFDSGIHTLVKALETDLEHVRAHTAWSEAAIDWDRYGRDRSRLLRGSELVDAERWLTAAAGKDPEPTELQAQLVQASREAARRRGRIIFSAVSFALVVAVVLAIVALIQRSNAIHEREVAFSRELDAQAQNLYETDPELSVLLAAEAADVAPGEATEEALREALRRSHVRDRYRSPRGTPGALLWEPGGERLLVADGDDRARIRRPGSDASPLVLDAGGLSGQIAWSRRGGRVATGGTRATVWDARSGRALRRLPPALQVALDSAGRRIATVDQDGTGHVYEVASGRQLARFPAGPGEKLANCLVWSPDDRTIAQCGIRGPRSINAKGAVRVWDAQTGRQLRAFPAPGLVVGAAFSPSGRRLIVGRPGDDPRAAGTFVFEVASGRVIARFKEASTAVAYGPSESQVGWATVGGLGHVYDLDTKVERVLIGHTDRIEAMAFSRAGDRVATGSLDHTGRIWDGATGEEQMLLAGHGENVGSVGFNRDGTALATASDDGTTRVWVTPKPRPVRSVSGEPAESLAFSRDGTRLLSVGPGAEGRILDARTLRTLARLSPPRGQVFTAAGWTPDGRHLGALTGVDEGDTVSPRSALMYDGRTGRRVATLAAGGGPVVTFFPSAEGRVTTLTADGEAREWETATGASVTRLRAPVRATGLGYSEDGSHLAVTYEDGTIRLWQSGEDEPLRTLRGPKPESQTPDAPIFVPPSAAFSPDGSLLATAGADDTIRLWEVDSGEEVRKLQAGDDPFFSLAFSPDGELLFGGDPARGHVWRVSSGDHLLELPHADPGTFGFAFPPFGVFGGFSEDGSTLVTSGDQAVKAWHDATGQELFSANAVRGDMTRDARFIATTGARGTELFRCELCGDLGALRDTAERNLTRGFTRAERARYLHEG